nr:hypothetical protein [Tanacetum cinerariifolium]
MEECYKMLTDQVNGLIQKVIKSGLSKGTRQAMLISKMKATCYLDFGLELLVHQRMWINEQDSQNSHEYTQCCSIKAFSRYRYDYLKVITLRRAGYQEYMIVEKDFKSCILRVEDFQLDIESYQKQLNLTKPGWDEKGFKFKHDYTIIELPRAVVFTVGNNKRKIMRFNEIYKFSDGTLINIMEALDYRAKEYKTQDQKDLPKFEMLCWWTGTRY